MARIVVGISGASGSVLAYKTILSLVREGHSVDLVMSSAGSRTARYELGEKFASAQLIKKQLKGFEEQVQVHSNHDIGASIASGSYAVDAMIVVPCSVATVAAIRVGLGDNLVRRSADVCIKEKRPLVLVVREMPLSPIHLENMQVLSERGVTIMPPMPAWYHNPKSLSEMEDMLVERFIEALRIGSSLTNIWQGSIK